MENKHPNLVSIANKQKHKHQTSPKLMFSLLVKVVFEWCRYITGKLLPFSVVKCSTVCDHMMYGPVSLNTLKNFKKLLTSATEQKSAACVPEN